MGEVLQRQTQREAHDGAGGVEEELGEEGREGCCEFLKPSISVSLFPHLVAGGNGFYG